ALPGAPRHRALPRRDRPRQGRPLPRPVHGRATHQRHHRDHRHRDARPARSHFFFAAAGLVVAFATIAFPRGSVTLFFMISACCALSFAPFATNASAASKRPMTSAIMSGVMLLPFMAFTSAPAAMRRLTTFG